ncbi:MAG: hypothetical protein QM790_09810 [Nibricoccus sp.]
MDNEEAKFILKAYRPNGSDAGDPRFVEALSQAERDPELRSWFEREQARDKAVATQLKSIPVPAGLRESILAGSKLSVAQRPWWRHPAYIGLAASFVIVCSLAVFRKTRGDAMDWSALTATVIDDASHPERHGSHGDAVKRAVALLSNPSTRLSAPMPINVGELKSNGCRTLSVNGHQVAEICFERNGGEFHLYVMERPAKTSVPAAPQFVTSNGVHSVLWTDPNHVYVMASKLDENALKALL